MKTLKPVLTMIDAVQGAAPPATVGRWLTGVFQHLERDHVKDTTHKTYREILAHFNLDKSSALAQAGLKIARMIDRVPTYNGAANAYHNANHVLEVMSAASILLALHDLRGTTPAFTDDDKLLLITGALLHDLGHNGKGNGMGVNRIPLLTEKHALALAEPVIREAFGDDTVEFRNTFHRLECLIFATDIGGGALSPGKFFERYAAYHDDRGQPPSAPIPELGPCVGTLYNDRALAELCCLMQDADLLPSIGLTTEWAETQGIRMGREDPSMLTATGAIDWSKTSWFHQNIAGLNSRAGQTFADNFAAITTYAVQQQQLKPN